MIDCDALVVGGGPAGSTCARLLRLAGWNVVLIDRAEFPRDKVCGGWLTPEVFALLDLDPAEYRGSGLTLQEITGFRTGLLGARLIDTPYRRVVSYAIRRCEFDHFLLERAGVRVRQAMPLHSLARTGDWWIANDEIRARIVIGAGGHFCPVARRLRAGTELVPVVAKEAEFHLAGASTTVDAEVPELFFCRDLEGYAWCVRKGEYLNVGIGRRSSAQFNAHVDAFIDFLERTGRAPRARGQRWRGHAYLAAGVRHPVVGDRLLLVGDAAGLAYPESGEGIKPAIESGVLAARTLIAAGGRVGADDLRHYAAALGRLHPPVQAPSPLVRPLVRAAGRLLLGSHSFTRRVVLDRWFLRAAAVAVAAVSPGQIGRIVLG